MPWRDYTDFSDHIEGEAEMAKKQSHFADDGVIDKHEQKEMDKAHKRQLESRGRGMAQVKAYRSAKWMARVSGPVSVGCEAQADI